MDSNMSESLTTTAKLLSTRMSSGLSNESGEARSVEQLLNDDGVSLVADGVFLPFWPHDGSTAAIIFHGIVYCLALVYIFVGVAIIADRFMAAIEQITSQEQDVIVRKPNGEKEIVSVRIWNETVSNLTLMALGSSAPEILLSIIEVYAQNFNAGELGPGTIVGSAAFNMFVIIAICVWVVPTDAAKKIKHLRVFCVTVVFSVFAYIWLLFILIWSSPGVIDVWEGLVTFAFFPFTVIFAYVADRRLLIYKYLSKHYRMNRKVVYGGEQTDNDNVELTSVEAKDAKVKVNDIDINGDIKYIDASEDDLRDFEEQREEAIVILREIKTRHPNASNEQIEKLAREELERVRPKSRAYYRILNARRLLGDVTDKIRDQFKKSINDYDDDEVDETKKLEPVKIYFSPSDYTVMENVGNLDLTVSRDGFSQSTVIVDYHTQDGTAKANTDYKPSKDIVTFGPGETHKQISIEIINDDEFEEDEHFFVILSNARYLAQQENNNEETRPDIEINESTAKVIILDDDHSGVFSFNSNVVQVPESVGEYRLNVSRFCGARGQVSLPYRTIAGTAKDNHDFISVEGKILFQNNEANKEIGIRIINTDSYEKNAFFHVELGEPKRIDSIDVDKGSPRLGELTKCTIRIRESREFKSTVDKLIKKSRTVSALTTNSWEEQFIEAITVPSLGAAKDDETDDTEVMVRVVEKKTIGSYIVHYLTLLWKVLFAFVPPPSYYNGWPCFCVSIFVIGILTALINDLASHFGATIGLKDSVTAISFVALGTSVPDTFASKIAAQNDKFADSSIGNVTGSNAVNVFLGIGIAWTMAAIYHFFKQTPGGFQVSPGSLSFSVTMFCVAAFICSAVLLIRRRVVGGELGGPMVYKLPTTLLFVGLWIFYLIMSSLEAYKIIPGF